MAVADYFARVAESAAQILRGFESDSFLARLSEAKVALAFDANALGTREGRATLDLSVRLFARFYPKLSILPLSPGYPADEYRSLAMSINPNLELSDVLDSEANVLVVGSTRLHCKGAVYCG